jgi:amidase
VADAAAVLGALVGVDSRDPATSKSEGKFHRDYTQFLDPDGLAGTRIGVVRNTGFFGYSEETDAIAEQAIQDMAAAGATIVDPVNIPSGDQILTDSAELIVLVFEFPIDLANYLSGRTGVPIRNLQDAIAFNLDHRAEEMPFFLQELFDFCDAGLFSQSDYRDALKRSHQLSRGQGVDATLRQNNLDCLVAPTGSPAWPTDLVNGDHFTGASSSPCAMAGYPIINVPAGYSFGLPVGMSFMGTAFSEPTLIKIASGYEAVTHHRRAPTFSTTLKANREKGAALRIDRGYRTTDELMQILRNGRSKRIHPFAGRL